MYIDDWFTIKDILLDPDSCYPEILIRSGFQSDPG